MHASLRRRLADKNIHTHECTKENLESQQATIDIRIHIQRGRRRRRRLEVLECICNEAAKERKELRLDLLLLLPPGGVSLVNSVLHIFQKEHEEQRQEEEDEEEEKDDEEEEA